MLEARRPRGRGNATAAGRSRTVISASKISQTRSAAVAASCAIDRIQPRSMMGYCSRTSRVVKATMAPSERSPCATAMPPMQHDEGHRDVGDQREQPPETCPQAHHVERVSAQRRRRGAEALLHERAPPERLHDPHPRRGLLGQGREVTLLVLDPTGDLSSTRRRSACRARSPAASSRARPTPSGA